MLVNRPGVILKSLHIHLDPVGGAAGDMFISAVLDAFPELRDGLVANIRSAGFPDSISVCIDAHRDHALTGLRFAIDESVQEEATGHHHDDHQHGHHHHRAYSDIKQQLQRSDLNDDVCAHTIGIFDLLAEAEANVHGMSIDTVTFHELGEWDSIADVVGAAFLIASLDANWTVGSLPLGRGRVNSAHGLLPVPAPATALLLEGFDCFDDGISGERVTPTGAAILRYLQANKPRSNQPGRLCAGGTGFGMRELPGMSNVLRLLAFETDQSSADSDCIAEIMFEVDDQTAEDLAIGLERLRTHAGVKEVFQQPVFGKKGRLLTQVRVLADNLQVDAVCEACFTETTTIGLRYQLMERRILTRQELMADAAGSAVRIKAVRRGDQITAKAEADDIANCPGGYSEREQLRRLAENSVKLTPLEVDDG